MLLFCRQSTARTGSDDRSPRFSERQRRGYLLRSAREPFHDGRVVLQQRSYDRA